MKWTRLVRLTVFGLVLLGAALDPAAADPQVDFYGIDPSNNLLRIDRLTFNTTVIGPVPADSVNGLVFVPEADLLYGITGSGTLLTIDRSSGTTRMLQTLTLPPSASAYGLAYENDNGSRRLYVTNAHGNHEFYRIDLTGAPPYPVQQLGTTGVFQILGMTFLPTTGELLAVCRNTMSLVKLDKATGQILLFYQQCGISNPDGLDCDPSTGEVFGTFDSGTLARYDTASGLATPLANTPLVRGVALAPSGTAPCDPVDDSNTQKYWYYRARLLNDFLVVGSDPGCSIPASERALYNGQIMKWGDAEFDLGFYLGVLGSEYRLLVDNNADVSRTVEELYFALQAFNRLDRTAETYWGGAPDLNGWFLRDDVPANFVSAHSAHFNSGDFSTRTVSTVNSDMTENHPYPGYESHDQVWPMLAGLALVKKFVDPSVTYAGVILTDEADAITRRVLGYMRDNGWKLENPVTGLCGECDSGKKHHPNCQSCRCNICGEIAVPLSFGAAEAGCKIIQGFNPWMPACSEFHNLVSRSMQSTWQNVWRFVPSWILGEEDYKFQNLAAIGASCGRWPLDYTVLELGRRAQERNYEHLPLLHQVLFNRPNMVPRNEYECLIDTAPCKGPYNFGNGDFPNFEWSSTERFHHPLRRGQYKPEFSGEYNGLGFMLLFNMYHLATNSTLPNYRYCHIDVRPPLTCEQPASLECGCGLFHGRDCWRAKRVCRQKCREAYREAKQECRTVKRDCKKDCRQTYGHGADYRACARDCRDEFRECKTVYREHKRECKDECSTVYERCKCNISGPEQERGSAPVTPPMSGELALDANGSAVLTAQNPFQPGSPMTLNLARSGAVDLRIVDLNGRRVRSLLSQEMSQGIHSITWDGLSENGERATSGLYFLVMRSDGKQVVKRLLFVR